MPSIQDDYDFTRMLPNVTLELQPTWLHHAPRNFADQITPTKTQRITLIVAACYILAIGILWHVPYLNIILYPFKLVTVGFHEMSHALIGVLTCAHIHSIDIDPDEGGATRMSGGIPWLTLPAGYLGSSFIGAALIVCGFNTNASKIACLVLAAFFLFTLWWARRDLTSWATIFVMSVLIVVFWFAGGGVALRFFILFMGVMSTMYVLWDIIDDTIKHKANGSDAYAFAEICGCFPAQVWGIIWLVQALIAFAAAIIIGLVAFKQSARQQAADAHHLLPVPGAPSGAAGLAPSWALAGAVLGAVLLGAGEMW